MSSNKKHYWLVSYVGNSKQGGSVHGNSTFSTTRPHFNMKALEEAQNVFPAGVVFVSVSHLGEMTEEEWGGEE